jgi:ATP-dependent protease ClpP protease subunit
MKRYSLMCWLIALALVGICFGALNIWYEPNQPPEVIPVVAVAPELLPRLCFLQEHGEQVARYFMDTIDSDDVYHVFKLLRESYPWVHKLTIELNCPGGNMFEMIRTVGLMQEFQDAGGIIETRVLGGAASGAFFIFVAGSKGHRVMAECALLMWHKPSVSNPALSEEAQRILAFFVKHLDAWLAKRSLLTEDEISAKIAEGDWWMSSREAIRCGFADRVL